MNELEKRISVLVKKKKIGSTIMFKPSKEAMNWIKQKSIEYGCTHSSFLAAIVATAMEDSKKP